MTTIDRDVPRLALVVPCYNESAGLRDAIVTIQESLRNWAALGIVKGDSFACFVDDGSTDGTWTIIKEACFSTKEIRGIKLSRNFGHQSAVLAGLLRLGPMTDCAVSIDADLQQDINAVVNFVNRYRDGVDIVLGVRRNRKSDRIVKRVTAEFFYWIMVRMGVTIVRNHADFRLLSRKVIEAMSLYPEANLFLRGLVHELGFRTEQVPFDVKERTTGQSKYSVRKMLSLAFNGVTSFSAFPLRLVAYLGGLVTLVSFGMAAYVLFQKIFSNSVIPGWASTVLPIYVLGGIQLLCMGVVGEYVGRVYMESKRRPRFLVEDEIL